MSKDAKLWFAASRQAFIPQTLTVHPRHARQKVKELGDTAMSISEKPPVLGTPQVCPLYRIPTPNRKIPNR